jgi:glutamate formiminotransferase
MIATGLVECVPNFSEGKRPEVMDAIQSAAASVRGALVLDRHADAVHNRMVLTIAGSPGPVAESAFRATARAVSLIDLDQHRGVHPRIGAADVVPVVAVRRDEAERARAAAHELARRVGDELGLPVFLYAELGDGHGPAFFRRGGPEELQRRIDAGELAPDFGPRQLDERAGGVIVGARRPLIAFNVNLAHADVGAARAIARTVRERDGGFPGVRALGLDLPRAGYAQISMNVEDWEAAALHDIVAAIEREAAARGVELAGAELVGLMPAGAAVAAAGALLRIDGFDASHVLELRLLEDSVQ